MPDVVIEGKVLRWGNSYGVRIKRADLEQADLQPGQEVVVRIERRGARVDLSDLPVFHGGHSDVSAQHDRYLAQRLEREMALDRDPANEGADTHDDAEEREGDA